MEEKLAQLGNMLSFKRKEVIYVNGTCDKNGVLKEKFSDSYIFDSNYDYYFSLTKLQVTSYFPNLTEKNNKFYYREKDSIEEKVITFQSGAYEIKDYDATIKDKIGSNSIQIILNEATAHVTIKLAEGWKIYFDREDTWRKELGFNSCILTGLNNLSNNKASIVSSEMIYISCDIIDGCRYKGSKSSIFFSFENAVDWGNLIKINPKHLEEYKLVKNEFSEINFKFFDDFDNAITFENSPVKFTLQIVQV